MSKIQKLLTVGDYVYSAANGQPLKVTSIFSAGFEAGGNIIAMASTENCFFYMSQA